MHNAAGRTLSFLCVARSQALFKAMSSTISTKRTQSFFELKNNFSIFSLTVTITLTMKKYSCLWIVVSLLFHFSSTSASLVDVKKRSNIGFPQLRSSIAPQSRHDVAVQEVGEDDEHCEGESDEHHHHHLVHHPHYHTLFHNFNHEICYPRNATVAHLNKGKTIINVNSANDDEKQWPLFDALAKGFRSVETGVWLLDSDNYGQQSQLYLGRNNLYLAPDANLENYYLQPIEKLIDEVNCKEHPLGESACDFNGLFFDSPEETFFLYIKFHTEASSTYKVLLTKLTSLINSEYLTYYDYEKDELVKGPVTIVLTGEQIPYEEIVSEEENSFFGDNKRYVFIDAPLEELPHHKELHFDYTKLSVTAGASLEKITGSTTFGSVAGGLTEEQQDAIKCKVEAAHNLGLLARVYYLPEYPRVTRGIIYEQLIDNHVDILNVIDNEAAYHF